MKKAEYLSIAYVIIAALLWGSNGIFVNLLSETGLNSFERTSIRLIFAAILETLIFLLSRKKEKISGKALGLSVIAGVFGMFGFLCTYTLCIDRVGMGTAAVLIYLMPTLVMIYSAVFSKEKITPVKIIALFLNLIGCGLVSNITSDVRIDIVGILIGILSAVCYASSNIAVSKMREYSAFSRVYYPTLFASLCGILYLILFSDSGKIMGILVHEPKYIIISCLWAICCSIATYLLFNTALKHISVTKASVLSSFELVFAIIFGVMFFNEPFSLINIIGSLLVMGSIILMELE